MKSAYPSGWQRRCFEYLGSVDGFELLRDGSNTLRTKNAYIEVIPEPGFKVMEAVYVNRKKSNGLIEKVHWHIKKSQPVYTVSINGVTSGYQYFDDDLAEIV